MKNLTEIFGVKQPVIGMLHLDYLEGEFFKGIDFVIDKALFDVKAMQKGGLDGIIIENWNELALGEFVNQTVRERLFEVCEGIVPEMKVPFGFNILNNDYKVAFDLAKTFGGSFVELDVFVDEVVSDFSTNEVAVKNPFEIHPNPKKIMNYTKMIGLENFPVFVFVQPKHYKMLNKDKKIEQSVAEAVENGVAGILVTKETGFAPTKEMIERARSGGHKIPVGIGSGFSRENASDFLPLVDFVVVGSALKKNGVLDNPVDESRVRRMMEVVRSLQK